VTRVNRTGANTWADTSQEVQESSNPLIPLSTNFRSNSLNDNCPNPAFYAKILGSPLATQPGVANSFPWWSYTTDHNSAWSGITFASCLPTHETMDPLENCSLGNSRQLLPTPSADRTYFDLGLTWYSNLTTASNSIVLSRRQYGWELPWRTVAGNQRVTGKVLVKPLQSWSKFCASSLKRSDYVGSGDKKINKQGIELHLDHRKIDPSTKDTHNVEKKGK
jgi:hypothetical protein